MPFTVMRLQDGNSNISYGDRYQRLNEYTTYTRSICVPYNSKKKVTYWNRMFRNGLCSSIFLTLHQIRYSSRPLVPGVAFRELTQLSDPGNDSENMATSPSGDSADEDMLDLTTRIRKHHDAHAQTISSEKNTASPKKNARTCPAPRKTKKQICLHKSSHFFHILPSISSGSGL